MKTIATSTTLFYRLDSPSIKLPQPLKSRDVRRLPSGRKSLKHFCNCTDTHTCERHHSNFVDCQFRKMSDKPMRNGRKEYNLEALFSSRKFDNIFKQELKDTYSNDSGHANKTIDLEEVQKEIEGVRTRLSKNLKPVGGRKRLLEPNRLSKDAIQCKFNTPNELKMPECASSDQKLNLRMGDINIKSKIDIWMSKNSFMPSLAPLPSLMKKFGEKVKDDKRRRDTYCSSQFQSPLLVGKSHNISQTHADRQESNRSMLYTDNFASRKMKDKPLTQFFK